MQAAHAQQLYDGGEDTVAQIAALLGVALTTVYGQPHRTAFLTLGGRIGGHDCEMPRVSTLPEFSRAVADFEVEDLQFAVEPAVLQAARGSIASCGLVMLGEVHGVAQNPLVVRALISL